MKAVTELPPPRNSATKFGLLDIWLHLHPNQATFSTYTRGSRRLDFALAPLSLANKAINIVYEPFHYRFFTDHRGFYIDFDTTLLFGANQNPVSNPQQRCFSSKDSKVVTTYLTTFDAHLTHNYVYNRLSSLLKSDSHHHNLIQIIEREITRAYQHAENTCRQCKLIYWTVDLHQAKLKLSVLCQIRSRLCQKLPIATIVHCAKHWDIIDPSGCNPKTVADAIEALKKEIRDIHKTSHDKRQAYLLASANISKDTDDKQKANIIQQMIKVKRGTEAYRRLG